MEIAEARRKRQANVIRRGCALGDAELRREIGKIEDTFIDWVKGTLSHN